MDDYEKNKGSLKVGDKVWILEQEFKSFATIVEQELLLNVNVTALNQNCYVLFHHKVLVETYCLKFF